MLNIFKSEIFSRAFYALAITAVASVAMVGTFDYATQALVI